MSTVVQECDPQFVAFEQSCRDAEWSRRCLFALLAYVGVPRVMWDVGCGNGHLVHTARSLGVKAYGCDLHVGDKHDFLVKRDLSKSNGVVKPAADLVLCWETAEHLPPSSADILCDCLFNATFDKGLLVFTAARSGQGGSGHLNEQPRKYWRDKLVSRGFQPDRLLTRQISSVWSQVAECCYWYHENVQCFRKAAA